MTETLQLRGTLRGHNGWVTQITTNPKYPDMILSSSRDKSLIVWKLTREDGQYGVPQKRLHGHSHFVSDVVLSSDGRSSNYNYNLISGEILFSYVQDTSLFPAPGTRTSVSGT